MDMNDFPFKWRFTDEKYRMLPPSVLADIRPLAIRVAEERWNKWVSAAGLKLPDLPKDGMNSISSNCGWGDRRKEEETRTKLRKSFQIGTENKLTFFWNARNAVETKWDIFVKYWPDFCYPSDDGDVVSIHDAPHALIYIKDRMWSVDRKAYFRRE